MAGIHRLLIYNADQIVRISDSNKLLLRKSEMNNIVVMDRQGHDGLSIVIGMDGRISDIGYNSEIEIKFKNATFQQTIDAQGKSIIPGLIDSHTHPVWSGDRIHEFSMKLAGASYMEIHNAGGGIHYTVDHTRQATDEELYYLLEDRLHRMLKCGSTLIEAKSGYGLDTQSEIKILRVLEKAKHNLPVEISSTFCGAHAVPRDMTSDEASEAIINEQLPAVKTAMENKEITVENIDVFCEVGTFDVMQSKNILKAGKAIGLKANFHGEEIHYLGSAEMGAEINATAISHLERISEEGIQQMAENNIIGVVLPTTAFILRLEPPPVRKMIEYGVPIALGSDFNPNAHCLSMPLSMFLACICFHMSANEALAAATINAAASLGRSETHGSLEIGKYGDLVIINSKRWDHLIYQIASEDHLIEYTIKKGKIAYKKSSTP